ncbi:MAG TPA: hypothetical protein VK524_15050 [Polyangiaceae bacterium]|nr:hypothetical protein [Polyangiaceae bacterium]
MIATYFRAWSIPAAVLAVTSGVALAQSANTPSKRFPDVKDSNTPRVQAAFRLDYSGPADCADQNAFLERVVSRSSELGADFANAKDRSVQLTIVNVGSELAGEARITRIGAATSVVAVGSCAVVLEKLAQLTVNFFDGKTEPASVRESTLPPNPYVRWQGPIGESLPRNPYPQLLNDIGPAVKTSEPQRIADRGITAKNPYRW